MNFLGMGPMELMLILVLALIIFGPGKLPEIAGQVGKTVRDFRRATSELSSEFNRTLSLEVEERKSPPAAPIAPAGVVAATEPAPAESPYVSPAPAPLATSTDANAPASVAPASVAPVTATPVTTVAPPLAGAPAASASTSAGGTGSGGDWHWETSTATSDPAPSTAPAEIAAPASRPGTNGAAVAKRHVDPDLAPPY